LLNLLAAGEVGEVFFFVEEHPRGESLAQITRERRERNQPFSDREALGLCWLLCRALEGVHESTVHGFLHPQDIYIEPWPDGPLPFYPRIAHIGIRAMLRAVRMPFEGLEEEAASYASPEFDAYGPLQKQVDVYGVGAILYGLLTLRAPTGCFVRPSSVRPGLSKALDRILLRALDEEPDSRYATPSALARALEGLWVLGTRRQELELAADWLTAGRVLGAGANRKACAQERNRSGRKKRGRSPREMSAAWGALSLVLSDKVVAACMILLMLLNLGLFLGAVMEAGSSRGDDFPDAKEFRRWESMFSDAGLGGPTGPTGAG
jgi:serine/threonine protein kinase